MNTLELLAPAGSPEALDAAVGEGADAVYLGLKDFNARMRSANFTYAQFEGALRSLRRMGKKVYVTVNTVFEQREADRMYQFLKYLCRQEPDAIIVQDFGVVEMARSEFPSLRLHASTQMNIASAKGANALSRHGVSRVVLARELSLEELKSIKKETNLELEVFVHGALCISVSGICLFSSYLGGKSANRGMCTQACRRLYHITDFSEGKSAAKAVKKNETEFSASGYYFSPNDLQLLENVPDLAEAGIKALKIEGRMKSASYVGAVVSAYRLVVDAVSGGDEEEIKLSIKKGQEILRNDFARPKTKYLFMDRGKKSIDWLNPQQDGGTGISLGIIQKAKGSGEDRKALVTPSQGISLSARDSVRVHKSDDSLRTSVKLSFAEKVHGGNSYWISAPEGQIGDHVYLIQTKEIRKRYAPVIAKSTGGKGPGREKAPAAQKKAGKQNIFPEGLYVAVSRPEDLYIVQSSRPQRVILSFSQKNARLLLADNPGKPLPFKPAEIILALDPFFPQEAASHGEVSRAGYEKETMPETIKYLTERGYHQYVVNNPGHFSLFRGLDQVKLIAGPWLYIFNSWALSFVSSFGVDGFISPLENSRQNLEKTLGAGKQEKKRLDRASALLRSNFLITVFAWPPLFSIRADTGSVINFNSFADNMGEAFTVNAGNEGTRVYPEKYFSIIDKIPFLKEAGFGRFIIDLTGKALKKSNYRDLMKAVNEKDGFIRPLPQSSRFNWKDGFYSG
ncbi:MAG: U32 family peptidase [Treponema sp.]|jgi:putative protease|nr:U32 family peptidase [Treponema sp.]